MKSKKNLVLLGMMGSGKSTIGNLISKKLNLKFIDIDKEFDFRTACAVIKNCDLFLGNEGGFGHASAAVII